jgi:hypothetical protein
MYETGSKRCTMPLSLSKKKTVRDCVSAVSMLGVVVFECSN